MNKPKVSAENFIDFLAATPVNATAMEAQRTNPVGSGELSHDTYTRLNHRLEPSSDSLWLEVKHEWEGLPMSKGQRPTNSYRLGAKNILGLRKILLSYRLQLGCHQYNWAATKVRVIQDAVRAFRANPWFR